MPRATELDLGALISEGCEHNLMGATGVVIQKQDRRPVVEAQLTERATLHEAVEPLASRLGAGVDIAGDVGCLPEIEQLAESVIGICFGFVLSQQRRQRNRRGRRY